MGCRAWAWFLPRFPVIFFPTGFFRQVFSGPHLTTMPCCTALVSFLAVIGGILEDGVELYMAFMYLFTVLWCSANTCKINQMVHHVLCLLHSEAEISSLWRSLPSGVATFGEEKTIYKVDTSEHVLRNKRRKFVKTVLKKRVENRPSCHLMKGLRFLF